MRTEVEDERKRMPATCRLLIQVVPRLMPGRCGVTDQAVLLARGLEEGFGIKSAFVVLNSTELSGLPYPEIHCKPAQLLESCLHLTGGEPGAILAHVISYGYSADGAPTLLAESLAAAKESCQFRIAAYFHEIYATGPPWKSAFWHSYRQRRALRGIVAQCELLVTNIQIHADWLGRQSRKLGGAPIELMTAISSSGETDDPTPFAQRSAALVVFGLSGTRMLAYRRLAAAGNLTEALDIREILDIGPECDHPTEVNGIRVRRMGLLPTEELSAVFSQARFGFVVYPWVCIGKSSVLNAYCAQGMIPVMTGPFPRESDGLRDGVQLVSPRTVDAVRKSGWEACSRAAWSWYMGHCLRVHVERYAKWVDECCEREHQLFPSRLDSQVVKP